MGTIGEREREILTAIVETFISTGEPVGSRMVARSNREGLSPATIRNVMADLSDAGFLDQPHTSAGRVPTTEAYRYYVEQLTGNAQLSHEDENIIQDSLHGIADVQEFMIAPRMCCPCSRTMWEWRSPSTGRRTPWSMCTSRGSETRRCWPWS